MKHTIYTITIKLDVCEDMSAKALEEIKKLRLFVLGKTGTLQGEGSVFDHATVLGPVRVDHQEVPLVPPEDPPVQSEASLVPSEVKQ